MPRLFRIEDYHRRLISKTTLLKVLTYLDETDFETPFLLMDTEQVRAKAEAIGKHITNARVFYAFKANPDPAVIQFLDGLGLGFEIASEGELAVLDRLGIPPERIISSNPIKTFKFLRAAAQYGVKYFSFDSQEEVDKIAEYIPDAKLYVRLAVPNEGSEWPLSRKFAVELEAALELVLYAKEKGLTPEGLTFHVGSQCNNIENWSSALYKAKTLWDMAADNGVQFRLLNLGGGYPIKYTKDVVSVEAIEQKVSSLIGDLFPPDIDVFIEPGRAMVGDAGMYVTTVTGKAQRGDENWLYIDVGVFNGLMESIGGIRYSYIVEDSGPAKKQKKHWTIAGPSCDSFDVIDTNVPLPEPDVGAVVLLLASGAYTISYASEFNGFSIPKTILI